MTTTSTSTATTNNNTKTTQTKEARVSKVLQKVAGKPKGITADRVSEASKVDKANVYRIVYDLRESGMNITSHYEVKNGVRKMVYLVG